MSTGHHEESIADILTSLRLDGDLPFTGEYSRNRSMRDPVEPKLVTDTHPKIDDRQPSNPWQEGSPHVGELPKFSGRMATGQLIEPVETPLD